MIFVCWASGTCCPSFHKVELIVSMHAASCLSTRASDACLSIADSHTQQSWLGFQIANGINAKNTFFSANERSKREGKRKEEEGTGERERRKGKGNWK